MKHPPTVFECLMVLLIILQGLLLWVLLGRVQAVKLVLP